MQTTNSGRYNLNEIPRSYLLNRASYVGQKLPTGTFRRRFAGAFRDNPVLVPRGVEAATRPVEPKFSLLQMERDVF